MACLPCLQWALVTLGFTPAEMEEQGGETEDLLSGESVLETLADRIYSECLECPLTPRDVVQVAWALSAHKVGAVTVSFSAHWHGTCGTRTVCGRSTPDGAISVLAARNRIDVVMLSVCCATAPLCSDADALASCHALHLPTHF